MSGNGDDSFKLFDVSDIICKEKETKPKSEYRRVRTWNQSTGEFVLESDMNHFIIIFRGSYNLISLIHLPTSYICIFRG